MGLTGDFAAMRKFIEKLGGLSTGDKDVATRIIDEAMGPIRALVADEFSSGASPYGESWVARKDGGQAFDGSDAAGRVQISKVGGSTLRASPAYPMHFHQEGTKSGGRVAQRRLKKAIVDRKTGEIVTQARASGDSTFGKRSSARKIARAESFDEVKSALAEMAANRQWHDPPRPVVPTDDEGIPPGWEDALRTAAKKIMAETIGATPTDGGGG